MANSLSQIEHIVWHPVESVMPENDRDVLIRTDSSTDPIWIGIYLKNYGWYWANGAPVDCGCCKVTHWAELPEGPK